MGVRRNSRIILSPTRPGRKQDMQKWPTNASHGMIVTKVSKPYITVAFTLSMLSYLSIYGTTWARLCHFTHENASIGGFMKRVNNMLYLPKLYNPNKTLEDYLLFGFTTTIECALHHPNPNEFFSTELLQILVKAYKIMQDRNIKKTTDAKTKRFPFILPQSFFINCLIFAMY